MEIKTNRKESVWKGEGEKRTREEIMRVGERGRNGRRERDGEGKIETSRWKRKKKRSERKTQEKRNAEKDGNRECFRENSRKRKIEKGNETETGKRIARA